MLPDQLLVAAGATAIIDLITVAVADEGDGILIGRPLYTSFAKDVSARAGAKMVPVSCEGKDPMSEEMVEQYEKELQNQEKAGTKIRGIILSRYVDLACLLKARRFVLAEPNFQSPHNPLGKCYVSVPQHDL